MVQTVHNNFEGYTKKQVEKAILDRKFKAIIGNPTDNKFKLMVSQELLNNFPVIIDDITNAHTIFVPQ